MKPSAVLAFTLSIAAWNLGAAVPGDWSTNLAAALAAGKEKQHPVIVYFTASWCGPCKLMARTTLTNEIVTAVLNGLPHVVVDIDDRRDLAEAHHVQAVPTFEILTATGDAVLRATGYKNADQFVSWLTNGVTEATAALARQTRLQARLTNVTQLARSADTNVLRKTATELFDLCAESDATVQKSAAAALGELAERNPAVLLDGLNHPRLATRIQVANLLRARLGESFDFDPWNDTASRQKAVGIWREKLAENNAPAGNNP